MKKIFPLFFSSLIFFSCSDNDNQKLEAFNAEAYAFDIGDYWEVTATARVKGYIQKEENNSFNATLSYDIDLINPSGDTLKSLISRTEDFSEREKVSDTAIEVQFELDSTYSEGNYKLIFNIKDANSDGLASAFTDFELVNE